jgi:hypothetical protein
MWPNSGLESSEEVLVMSVKRIGPGRPAYQAAPHRTARYPAEHVTLTAGLRKRVRTCVPHRKTGRGKVGVGGMH